MSKERDSKAMSLATIELRKINETSTEVTYEVHTPDFSKNAQYEPVAELLIEKVNSKYSFKRKNYWADKKVVPPHTYELEANDLESALANQFKDHGYGAWTGRISSQVSKMLKSGTFPEKCP